MTQVSVLTPPPSKEHMDAATLCLAVVPKEGFPTASDVVHFPLYWLLAQGNADELINAAFIKTLEEVLIDPLTEKLIYAKCAERLDWVKGWKEKDFYWFAERQFLPGVTDNLASTVEEALGLSNLPSGIKVASGNGLLFRQKSFRSTKEIDNACRYKYFHPLADRFVVHELDKVISASDPLLSFPQVSLPNPPVVEVVNLDLDDDGLMQLSKARVLALSLQEMQAIRDYFKSDGVRRQRSSAGLLAWPTDVELEILAQTWSEHCKHKIFNATIEHTSTLDGKTEKIKIDSLYKTYIKAATKQLSSKRSDLLSVFEDNAGVVRFNNKWAVCFKVETHNSPSALEPYGGALTGILGVNRDILGTGLGAKPIFNTDVFCFAYPNANLPNRPTMLPADVIIKGVRKGVEDGGNKSGIATINGGVYFHPGYRAKPLVFCGTGGLLPITINDQSAVQKHTQVGDSIVMVGGRVGKDGIHGATFSSEVLHEGSPVSAVQIGDPFTQKRVLDFVIEARDLGLITGITDNGAGGLSSSVGEMAQITGGATLELDNVPLKYPGLADWEIVVSESQERMTISTRMVAELKRLANKHRVEITEIGTFHARGCFEITRHGKPVGMLPLEFLHNGAPKLRLESQVGKAPAIKEKIGEQAADLSNVLLKLLAHPNICSREGIIRQYDHEVQGLSVIKALMGPLQQGPCDAAVIKPLYDDDAALVVSNGLCPQLSEHDAYLMAMCAVDEAVRNAVCVGGDPETLSVLDNFCWPDPIVSSRNPDGKEKLGQLVRACQGLYDAVIAYGCPLISGKDSMKNDFDDGVVRISIPPTLLVSAIGKVSDANNAISMEFKQAGDLIYLLAAGELGLAHSQYLETMSWQSAVLPTINLEQAARLYRHLHGAIEDELIHSAHDLSEGGLAVALAECIIGSGLGAEIDAEQVVSASGNLKRLDHALFAEGPARIVVSIKREEQERFEKRFAGFDYWPLGRVITDDKWRIVDQKSGDIVNVSCAAMVTAWKTPLPID
jgi:phosphoribosylformylglycinamidine synthase